MQKISVAFTHHNRADMLMEAMAAVLDDERVAEIVISDDCSTDGSYEWLKIFYVNKPKIKFYKNEKNLGMSLNKRAAVDLCEENWVALWDSDNIFDKSYLDALYAVEDVFMEPYEFLMPAWAAPNFDYRAFEGIVIDKTSVSKYLDKPYFEQAINTCNMVVNRQSYLDVYEHNPSVKEVDTLWMNYLWLNARGSFFIVPGMYYQHRVHSGSGWLSNAAENIAKGEEIKTLIRQL